MEQWTLQSRKHLRETYGADADARLERVQAFVDARPALKALLSSTGLGSHPRVIAMLAKNTSKLRVSPRKR